MNNLYIEEYADIFQKILSIGHSRSYSTSAIEKRISSSLYFQYIEKDDKSLPLSVDEEVLIKEIFPELNIDLYKVKSFSECLWAAYAYLYIQESTKLTFECIFLYIPIVSMFKYFNVYHEMDFSQIVKEFDNLYRKESALSLLINKYGFSLYDVCKMTGLSYATLSSLKQRKRDIKKLNVNDAVKLASFFRVRVETICEMKL